MEYHEANFATFVSQLTFPPQKMDMNLISYRLSTASIKHLNWPSPVFGRFQNRCNKVVIEPSVVQFRSKITRMISAQIALHSVQLPLLIELRKPNLNIYFLIKITKNNQHEQNMTNIAGKKL